MFLRQLFEAPRTAVVAFGRMNPPTIGHQKLVDKIKSIPGDHYVFLSQSQKPKTDPLSFEDKLRYAKFFFPNITVGHPEVKTIIQALQKLEQLGYENIVYVAGSDRVQSFEELLNKYNGVADKSGNIPYSFKSIKIVSAGERDPDADGAEGMSASKMRQAAVDNDLESFKQGVPQQEVADEMFAAVRKGMGVRDEVPAEGIEESIGSDINFPGFDDEEEKKKKKKKKKQSWLAKAKALVGLEEAATSADADGMITAIKTFQQAAGLKADGIVGPNTRAKAAEMIKDPAQAQAVTTLQSAIKSFQTKAGIAVDGKVGPETMGAVKQAQSGGGAAPAAPAGNANAGVDGAADATADAAQGGDATTPAQKPQTANNATKNAGQQQTTDPNAQKAKPEDPKTTTPVNNTDNEKPAEEKPAAAPKVSSEKYMQMSDRGPGLGNFNVAKMKAKYPKPYLDIPNDDGTVTRAYGPTKNLQAFIDSDSRGKGLKLSGGTAAPAQQTDQQQGDAQQTDQQQDATAQDKQQDATAPKQTFNVNGKEMPRADVKARIEALLKKKSATEGIVFKSKMASLLEALTKAEQAELDSLLAVVKDDPEFAKLVKQATTSTTAPTEKPNTGSEYELDGKKVSRDEYEKTFGKDLSGRTNDYNRLKNQIQGLSKKASDEKREWTQQQLDDPDSPYYRGVPTDKRDPDYPKELTAIDDKYAAEAKKLQAQADKLASDPEVKKMIDKGGDKFDRALAGDDDDFFDTIKRPKGSPEVEKARDKIKKQKDPFADDPEGDAEFDKALDGDDDDKPGTTTTKTSSKDGNTTRTSSSTSTVTRSGGTSTTKKVSGGGSTTRFSKQMKDGPDTADLKAEKKELRKQMRAFADEFDKNNPDAGNFDYLDDPEYQKLKAQKDEYEGMDGKIAKSEVVLHPSGTVDTDGNITYNTKDGKWDGEQFDPDRKKKK